MKNINKQEKIKDLALTIGRLVDENMIKYGITDIEVSGVLALINYACLNAGGEQILEKQIRKLN